MERYYRPHPPLRLVASGPTISTSFTVNKGAKKNIFAFLTVVFEHFLVILRRFSFLPLLKGVTSQNIRHEPFTENNPYQHHRHCR